MQNEDKSVEELRIQAKKCLGTITKQDVSCILCYSNHPPGLFFTLLISLAMITDQDLSKNKQLFYTLNPSKPKKLQNKKLFYLFKSFFVQQDINQVVSQIDPTKLSEQTVGYMRRLIIQNMEGSDPELTEEKIGKMYATLPLRLYKWCKLMLEVRKKLLIDDQCI